MDPQLQQKIQQAIQMGVPEDVVMERVNRSQARKQPSQQSAAPAVGQFVGSLAGTAGGPIGRMVGGAVGAGIGQEINQSTDPTALFGFIPPLDLLDRIVKGSEKGTSKTEKAMQTGAAAGLTGEAMAGMFHLLKPGVIPKALNNITEYFASKGKGKLSMEQLMGRFLNETLPKAFRSSGELSKGVIKEEGENLLAQTGISNIDTSEINFIRQQFNALGKGRMAADLKKFIANDLARILREEEVKRAPMTGVSITAERGARAIPSLIGSLPGGQFLNQLTGMIGGGASSIGKALSRFGIPPLLQSGVNK